MERLKCSTEAIPLFRLGRPGTQTYYCKVSGHKFRLFTLGPDYFNSLMPFFSGTLRGSSKGTIVQGRLHYHRLILAFLVLWFGGVAGFGVLMVWAAVTGDGVFSVHPALAMLPLLFMAAFGVVAVKRGLAVARDQAKVLLGFMRTTLVLGPGKKCTKAGDLFAD